MFNSEYPNQNLSDGATSRNNSELWFCFVQQSEKYMNLVGDMERKNVMQSFDLLRAINSYRSHRTFEDLFNAYPYLKDQKDYVELLWRHFDSMSQEQLSELAMQMIHEVSI